MTPEALLAAGYALVLAAGVGALEWLSAHTHRRAMLWRTAGFEYDEHHDAWLCPEGEHLWPHEFDHERRLVRYRARPQVCNGCPVKHACTDSDQGREVVRALDPWPHSEAGRFHRGISLVLIVLALLVLGVGAVRNTSPADLALLAGVLVACLLIGRRLVRDFRAHPAGFPAPAPSHGLRMARGDVAYGDWGSFADPRLAAGAEGGGTTGPMSPSGASSRSTITGA
jgi:hypothetical protein